MSPTSQKDFCNNIRHKRPLTGRRLSHDAPVQCCNGFSSSKSTAEWLAIFQAVDIAAMPVHSLETLRRDEHLVAVDLVKMEDHPTEGRVAAIRSTIRIDDEYPPRLSPAQPRGSETRVLLHEVGLSAKEIDDLISSGTAIAQQN